MATLPYRISASDDPFYRSSDGLPMSDNPNQWEWMVAVKAGLDAQYLADPDVLVVGNCLWYPVEGNNKIRAAPDAMVVLGRPKGDRGSYIQHREEGVAPQVAFEVLSPGNRAGEMRKKLAFYEQYGVEEYYVLDPDFARHQGYLRSKLGRLEPIAELFGWVSPRLGIRFELTDELPPELRIIGADGYSFETVGFEASRRRAVEQELDAERRDRQLAEDRAAAERRDREAVAQDNERLRARLRELGLDPDA